MLSVVSVLINIAALWRFLRVASVSLPDLWARPPGSSTLSAVPLAVILLVSVALPAALLVVCAVGWAVVLLPRRPAPGRAQGVPVRVP